MSIPMNPYGGGQNLFNFLPGGYYNPDGTGNVPGVSNNPQLQGFVNQLLGLMQEGGGYSQAETTWRDNWLREHGYGHLFPPQQKSLQPVNQPAPGMGGGWYKPPYQPPRPAPGLDQMQNGGPYIPRPALPPTSVTNPYLQPNQVGLPNMGPNFGGAVPAGSGIGSYGPAGPKDLVYRGPFPQQMVDKYKQMATNPNWDLKPGQAMPSGIPRGGPYGGSYVPPGMVGPTKTLMGPNGQPRTVADRQAQFANQIPQAPRFMPGSNFGRLGSPMRKQFAGPMTGMSQQLLNAARQAPPRPVTNPWFRAGPTLE